MKEQITNFIIDKRINYKIFNAFENVSIFYGKVLNFFSFLKKKQKKNNKLDIITKLFQNVN